MKTPDIDELISRVSQGRRLTPAEGALLYREAGLNLLGALAQQARFKKVPGRQVTWVADNSLNFTNVCDSRCAFCAFCRRPGEKDAFLRTVPEMTALVKASVERHGLTTVLLQGGLDPSLPFDYYVDLVKSLRAAVPQAHLHLFSAPEIHKMSQVTGRDARWVLTELKQAGLTTLPGGGAEILSDRIRRQLSPNKVDCSGWIDIHKTAHELGYRSTATMVFGQIEEPEDIFEHLERIRTLQDQTGGFTAFIPWSFKPKNTPLGDRVLHPAGAAAYLRLIASARLYLDNFEHIQASWFSEGEKTGQTALHFGADDLGGTVFDESVLLSTDWECKATVAEIQDLIKAAGFEPVQRDTLYNRAASL
jgi:cyclic dehypoxanthinyl futalosine synthase